MMLVYVLNKDGNPLMPCKASKARKLLKFNKAKVVNRTPFTIQLLYGSSGYKQSTILGVDTGSKNIGLSVTTNKQELFSAEVLLRDDIVEKLSTRREMRKVRRNRNTRYRQPRFNNRIKNKKDGWLPPSALQKINSHIQIINKIYKVLPISNIIIEVASFDIQKIKNPDIQGVEYQQGEQLGFWNVREYVLFRDNHVCQCCKGKSKDKILNVHHIESRKTGGDSPNNLITLCETCHQKYHKGELNVSLKRNTKSLRNEALMNSTRWILYKKIKEIYPNCKLTYGYITKNKRIKNNLPKTHAVDAFCISNNLSAERLNYYYQYKCMRNHNRQIHKIQIYKGNVRKPHNLGKYVKGFQAFDKVKILNIDMVGFIKARRVRGVFTISDIYGNAFKDVSYKKIKLLESRKSMLVELQYQNIK